MGEKEMKRMSMIIVMVLLAAVIIMTGCQQGPSQADLDKAKADLTICQTASKALQVEKEAWTKEKADLNKQVNDLKTQMPAGKDPTYAEAVKLMKEDKTDQEIQGDHSLAVMVVVNNIRKRGINCYYVIAQTKEGPFKGGFGYNLVGFKTTDKGWVYFCAAMICADKEIKLELNKKLFQLNSIPNDVPQYDDTIININYL